ncbi:MAG: hypothetical protein LBN21_00880 [Treponema sp.]|jgi:hypothetical protein|nr:hypothetical protein [Treponema sp.]
MAEIKTGIEISLKDKFSSGMKDAAASAKNFGEKAVSAANTANRAFSGIGAQIASLGVTLGAGALLKASIDYEDRLVRIGTNAGMSAQETNRLRRELIAIAQETKISKDEMTAYAATLADNSIEFETIKESARFAALAVQGLGLSGAEAGELFSVLHLRGADVDIFKTKLNNLAEIDDRLQGMGLAEFTRYIPQLMEFSDTPIENLESLYTTILTLNKGAKNTKAIQQYQSAMQDFANPETRDAMRKYLNGFDTKQYGKLKDFTVIMDALVEKGNKIGDLGDTHDAVSGRAEANMKTMKSALNGLQNAIMAQSDSALIKPLETVTRLLNENPKGLEIAIKGIGGALLLLTGMKAFSTVISFIGNIKSMKAGNIGGGLSGGAGIPVTVTNMGGAGTLLNGMPVDGKGSTAYNTARSAFRNIGGAKGAMKIGGGAALSAALFAMPDMINELDGINQNEELTEKEKGKAKGGAVGQAVGSIGGAAAGAIAGAAIGSVVPVVGTALGALAGGLIGYFGGKTGRSIGEAIGEGLADDKQIVKNQPNMYSMELQSVPHLAETAQPVTFDGQAIMDVNVNLTGDRPTASVAISNNTTPVRFNPGSAPRARMVNR